MNAAYTALAVTFYISAAGLVLVAIILGWYGVIENTSTRAKWFALAALPLTAGLGTFFAVLA